jgi:hypothetical protein
MRYANIVGPVVSTLSSGGGTHSLRFPDPLGVEVAIRQADCTARPVMAPPLTVITSDGSALRTTPEYGDPDNQTAPVPVPVGGFSGYAVVPASGIVTATVTTTCSATITVSAFVCSSSEVRYRDGCTEKHD